MIKQEKKSIKIFITLSLMALALLPLLFIILNNTLSEDKQAINKNKCFDNSDPFITKVIDCQN